MTEEELIEIENRCKAATEGAWKSYVEGRDHESGDSFIMTGVDKGENIWSSSRQQDIYLSGATVADQDFIAHAREDIPKLLAEIKRLKNLINE